MGRSVNNFRWNIYKYKFILLFKEFITVVLFFLEKVTKDDILRVARRLLSSQPSIAARGDLRKLPSLDYIQAALIDSEGKLPGRKLSLFR